jgi:alpha-ketoglutarate-dependent taurine dioxygenase
MKTESVRHSLRKIRRTGVALDAREMIRSRPLLEGSRLPLLVEPAAPDLDLLDWARGNLDFIERQLLDHGGILLRGFKVPSTERFYELAAIVCPELVNYMEGSSPRINLRDKVYTSTEYPPELFVSLHNELSYAHKWPRKIFFHCVTMPQEGGETPIADSRKIFELIEPEVRDRFLRKGVMYTRNLHGGRGAGLSWQTVFETDDRSVVEEYCREGGIDFTWKSDGGLQTRQVRPAVVRHPKTGETIWFSQVHQFHPSNLGDRDAQALLSSTSEEDLPINGFYGDGSPLEEEALAQIRAAYDQAMVKFPWQKGDVMILDNMLTAHGRMPFSGPRRIVVAMGETVRLKDLEPSEVGG